MNVQCILPESGQRSLLVNNGTENYFLTQLKARKDRSERVKNYKGSEFKIA